MVFGFFLHDHANLLWAQRLDEAKRQINAHDPCAGKACIASILWMRRLDEAKAEVTLLGIMLRLGIMYY